MSTSEIHLDPPVQNDQDEGAGSDYQNAVTHARSFTDDVEWSAMDATRTDA
jgi:hypothetical protein